MTNVASYRDLVEKARGGGVAVAEQALAVPRPAPLAVVEPVGKAVPAKKIAPVALPEDPEDHVWERLRGEPMHWFVRFQAYRDMAYDAQGHRTQTRAKWRVYQAEYARKHGRQSKNPYAIPQGWQRQVQRWRWHERAEAYDVYRDERARVEASERARMDRTERVDTLKAIRARLLRRIHAMDDAEIARLPVSVTLSGLTAVTRELRAESEGALRRISEEIDAQEIPFKAYGGELAARLDEI